MGRSIRTPRRAALARRAATLAAVAATAWSTELRAQSQSPARAQTPSPQAQRAGRRPLDVSLALKAGTLGYGLEVGKLVMSHLAVRAGGSLFSYNRTQELEGVTYDGALELRNASLLVDLFPAARGSFHVTGGIVAGSNDITARGAPDGDEYSIGGGTYAAADVGRLTGAVRFPRARPYAGIGWGTPANRGRGIGFVTDIGVAFGTPRFALDATGPANGDADFRTDLEDQRATTQTQLDQYVRVYPVLAMGLTYRF